MRKVEGKKLITSNLKYIIVKNLYYTFTRIFSVFRDSDEDEGKSFQSYGFCQSGMMKPMHHFESAALAASQGSVTERYLPSSAYVS